VSRPADASVSTTSAAAGAVSYCAIFALISVLSRHAVILGLGYALIWESVIGQYVPGARLLSIQQWALAIGHTVHPIAAMQADVSLAAALSLLIVVTAGVTALASRALGSLKVAGVD